MPCLFAQSVPTEGAVVSAVSAQEEAGLFSTKTSLTAVRVESKLNPLALHKSVLDYSLPEAVEEIMPKCVAGEVETCYFALKAFENSSDTRVAAQANIELAVLSLQRGLVSQAIAHIDKACLLNPEDPFAELTRGWILLAAGKYKKARQSFDHLFYLTADLEYVSSAKLGSALVGYFSGSKESAATELQYLYTSNPYMLSLVSYLMGDITAQKKKTRHLSSVFLQQALTHDERNYAADKLLAKLAEDNDKDPQKLRAFQYYATLYSMDPQNEELAEKVEKYGQDIGDKALDYLFYLRLEQPIVHELASIPSSKVRMALYANRNSTPQELQEIVFTASGVVRLQDEKLGEVLQIPSYIEKHISFNEQTRGVDFKNSKGHVEFSARRPFTLTLDNERKTLLVRNAKTESHFAADLSDKELKGSLTVVPTADGFYLINEAYSEDLVPALLATKVQDITNEEALKAFAVVMRTALLQAVNTRPNAKYHITDNDGLFTFKGINLIFKELLEAVHASSTVQLTQAQADIYDSCGVVTADTLENTATKPNYTYSPANVSKYMLSNPPADLYSTPSDPTQWARVKWMYLYDASDIQTRLAYKQDIGKLRALMPLKLSPNGRVLSMRFEGSKGSYEAQTPQEVSFLLSAGTMRSNFFDIVPLYKGKYIRQILVRGYDTGLGEGLCLRGSEGLAKNGADAMAIIKYYFPDAHLIDTTTGTVN